MDEHGNTHTCCEQIGQFRKIEKRMDTVLEDPAATLESVRAAWLFSVEDHLGKCSRRNIAAALKRTFGDKK